MFKSALFRGPIPNGCQPIADDYPDDLVKPYSGASYILGLKVSMYDNGRPSGQYHHPSVWLSTTLFRACSHHTLRDTLISVLTLSITRLCFPSWRREHGQMCEMLIQRVWRHTCKLSRSKFLTWVRIPGWGFSIFATFCMVRGVNQKWPPVHFCI